MVNIKHNPKSSTELKVLIIYWSATGNTEKVVNAIQKGLVSEKVTPKVIKLPEAEEVELYEYDLVFIGTPSYSWQAPKPVQKYIEAKMDYHRKRGDIKLCAPKLPGKRAGSLLRSPLARWGETSSIVLDERVRTLPGCLPIDGRSSGCPVAGRRCGPSR